MTQEEIRQEIEKLHNVLIDNFNTMSAIEKKFIGKRIIKLNKKLK